MHEDLLDFFFVAVLTIATGVLGGIVLYRIRIWMHHPERDAQQFALGITIGLCVGMSTPMIFSIS